jgi:hypothetical protein
VPNRQFAVEARVILTNKCLDLICADFFGWIILCVGRE